MRPSIAWRFAMLAGATTGLALSAAVRPPGSGLSLLLASAAAGLGLALTRPSTRPAACAIWLALVALTAAAAGLAGGALRLAAIDGGAFDGPVGRAVSARGFVTAVPHRSEGEVSVRVETDDGRLAIEAPEPVPDLPIGREIAARGVLRGPDDRQSAYLARFGISEILAANRIQVTGGRRGGAAAVVDRVRDRAEAALGEGTPEGEAALLRGFVLGEDDRIDPRTVDDFKRSGLAHLLAVSGDCVMLLALLGAAILGLLGVPLRARLLCLLALIAVYVPVTGAAPSIQRAGIMGAAGLVSALAGRPRSRWYAVLLAACTTLALNPRWISDPAWQLSFAAVVGILLFASRIRDLLLGAHREPSGRASPARRALAEGAGVTVAATLSTAPLFAHHFGTVSLAALPANLLALPAIAPAMWLAMLSAILGQVPGLPVEPFTALAGLLAAYVAQVAHWFAAPGWSQANVALPGWPAVAGSYAALLVGASGGLALARRRRGLALPPTRRIALAGGIAIAACVVASQVGALGSAPSPPTPGLRVTVLDVGQGDAILLQPAHAGSVLVDGGPPGDDLRDLLERAGASSLAAAVVTHDQSDHVGGIEELVASFPVRRLLYAEPGADFLRAARAAGVPTDSVAEGAEVDSGAARLDVLWPPRALLEGPPPEDLNQAALVLLARWHGFSMLLTADAEAEAVPIDSGPVDVLKVAHHGSDDAGLDALLDRTTPRLAVISVGAHNPYGHPTAGTLSTLAEHRIPTLRTDQEGNVTIDVTRRGWWVEG
jgi:competence protein ComEC